MKQKKQDINAVNKMSRGHSIFRGEGITLKGDPIIVVSKP